MSDGSEIPPVARRPGQALRLAGAGGLLLLCLAGCAAMPGARRWGEDATISPGWARVRAAAVNAARDPWVWAPLAGAAGLQIGSWDRKISDWAIRETPVFGSPQNAASWSNDLRNAVILADTVTTLLAPSGDDSRTWIVNKLEGYAVDLAAVGAANGVTGVLKVNVGRMRPSMTNTESFPSGHTTAAATSGRLAALNLAYFDLSADTRRRMTYGLDALTIATAWARVEAGAHYPADTLVGMAIGNFSARFFREAFFDPAGDGRQALAVVPADGGLMLRYSIAF